jgi:hypothetical protein
MNLLKEYGCVKVSNWYLDEEGKVKLDFPASIENTPGVLIIASDTDVMAVAATKHYGPRIRDFIHSITGDNPDARTHKRIEDYLAAGSKDLALWRKNDPNHHAAKAEIKAAFPLKWN